MLGFLYLSKTNDTSIYMFQMLDARFCLVDNSVYNFYALQWTNPLFQVGVGS